MYDISAGNVIVGSLTSSSVPFIGSDKKLTETNNFTFDSNAKKLTVGNIAINDNGNIKYNSATLNLSRLAGSTVVTVPNTTGNVITTGDSSTVTNTMLAGSIDNSKLLDITTASKVWGNAIVLDTVTGIDVSSGGSRGLRLKTNLAGTGLNMTNLGSDQVLSINTSLITSVGTLTSLSTSGNVSVTGNVTVNGISNSIIADNAIFKTVSEVGNVITIGGSNSISVDYRNNGAVLYWTATGTVAGPYTFNITNVPDLTTQSHIVTALTTAPSTNITTQYFSTISINGGTATSVLWSNGTLPDLADVAVGNVIVQQFYILPSNFISPQKVLSNVNYFK